MKKILFTLAVFILLLLPMFVFAAGSCTATDASAGSPMVGIITYSCTGDSSTGTISATASPYVFGWVFMVITVPGTPSPTNGYSLTLSDSSGIDVVAGLLASRSSTNPQQINPAGRYVNGPLTLAASGQSVASAIFTVKVYYYRENAQSR
jgi:hypothetical protein